MIDADWNRKAGDGTHATLSRFDVNNLLVAAGPDFRRGLETSAPSGNIDISPTVLAICGIEVPKGTDGRRLDSGMDGISDWHPRTDTRFFNAVSGEWRQHLEVAHFGGSDYVEPQEASP